MDEAEQAKQQFEEQKVALDYIKHVSTLATSVIVFSVAFIDKIARQPSWKWLMIPALGGELLCLVTLTLAAVGAISAGRVGDPPTQGLVRFTVAGTLVGLAAFLVGVASLSVFLVRNLL